MYRESSELMYGVNKYLNSLIVWDITNNNYKIFVICLLNVDMFSTIIVIKYQLSSSWLFIVLI